MIRKDEGILRPEYRMRFFIDSTAGAKQAQNVTGKHWELGTRVDALAYRSDDIESHVEIGPLGDDVAKAITERSSPRCGINGT